MNKTQPRQGGCQCRAVRYAFSGRPITCYACHCTDCQTASGSAFSLSMIVAGEALGILSGEVSVGAMEKKSGEVDIHHCSGCGTALWYSSPEMPKIAALKPGTFDDTSWVKPIAHLWVRSAQPWMVFDGKTVTFETQPNMAELVRLWEAADS